MNSAPLRFCVCILFITWLNSAFAQENKLTFWQPSPVPDKQRIQIVSYTTAGLYAVTMTGLYQLWYKDYPLTAFHTFDDNGEWLQIDKGGHLINSYYIGKFGVEILKWTGMPQKKAAWIGGNAGLAFLTSIEIFDGFSEQWGFSTGDVVANTAGAATCVVQELLWQEQRIEWKLSFNPSPYAKYRPDEFGTTFPEKLVKDYNGHTFWLSANVSSFLIENSKFPKWLNLSIGYGADGLTGGHKNITEYNGAPVPQFQRYRQFYFAPDFNLTRIKTKSQFLRVVFNATRFIKFPLPAIEYNEKQKWVFHGIFF